VSRESTSGKDQGSSALNTIYQNADVKRLTGCTIGKNSATPVERELREAAQTSANLRRRSAHLGHRLWLILSAGDAFESPTWRAVLPELAPKEDLVSATSLNGIEFNFARAPEQSRPPHWGYS
jgi:Transmembrane secretion effector